MRFNSKQKYSDKDCEVKRRPLISLINTTDNNKKGGIREELFGNGGCYEIMNREIKDKKSDLPKSQMSSQIKISKSVTFYTVR